MKKLPFAFALALVVGSAMLSDAALAGLKNTYEVWISSFSSASGAIGSVRGSSGNTQYIGCSVTGQTGIATRVRCSATNAAGTSVSCVSSQATHVAAVSAITANSYIFFNWGSDGTCTQVVTYADSESMPATP